MSEQPDSETALGLSYLRLRKMIGIIGTSLPFVLVIGKFLIEGWGIQGSISAYYYTGMRNVFVGGLCAIAVFLISYNMYKKDYIAGRLAGAFAIGVALFPTKPVGYTTASQNIVGTLHLACAAAYFLILAYFSLALFTKTDPLKIPTQRKLQRNIIYKICGVTILVCLALMILAAILPNKTFRDQFHPLFWLESIATTAFGISWLTKGDAILPDN